MENEIIDKICARAFAFAVIGTCIIGICPAFGIMTLSTEYILKKRGIELNSLNDDRMKKGRFLAILSLLMFIADIAIALFVYNTFSK